jgi:hypothetical protein
MDELKTTAERIIYRLALDCEYCGHGWCLAFRQDDAVKLKISAGKFNPEGKFLE